VGLLGVTTSGFLYLNGEMPRSTLARLKVCPNGKPIQTSDEANLTLSIQEAWA